MVAVHVERLDHLARLLPTPKRAKVELGSGITAGSALRYPLERLDLVEISAGVVEAAKFFIDHNYNALQDPRLHLYLEDANTFLRVSPRGHDVIITGLWPF